MKFEAFNVYKGLGRKMRQQGYKADPNVTGEEMMAKELAYRSNVEKLQ
jgi:hypothetical protein